MSGSSLLEAVAKDLLKAEVAKECRAPGVQESGARCTSAPEGLDVCPVCCLLPELIGLVAQSPREQVGRLAPAIRSRVTELCFIEEAGDIVFDLDEQHQVDHQVDILVRVLEQVRQLALAQGWWSERREASHMFG